MADKDHSYVARYENEEGDELPLEVLERERARMLVALRDYCDRIERAPMTRDFAVVFAAHWQEEGGGSTAMGFGNADDVAKLLFMLTMRTAQVDAGVDDDGNPY